MNKEPSLTMDLPKSTSPTVWTEDRVRRLLTEEHFSYQRISLPYNLHTEGKDRSATCRKILPDDLTGKTVLDVGSYNGYFCFEALKRGAKSALGFELHADRLRKAKLLAECLGSPAEFRAADVEREPIDGQFDYVLCLNVLHHLRNPLAALQKLIAVTREKLILEVAALGGRERRKIKLPWTSGWILNRSPILFVSQRELPTRDYGQRFFITAAAIKNLLLLHGNMFASVNILPSDRKGRFIAVAYKRQIDKLLVVAGPSSAGKSTLIRRLRRGELPQIEELIGFSLSGVRVASGRNLPRLREAQLDRLIFHYDFLRPRWRSACIYERDEALDILDCANEVTFVTIWTPPDVLLRQFEQDEPPPGGKRLVAWKIRRHNIVHERYRNPANVYSFYKDWFGFCRARPGKHVVVSFEGGLQFYSPDEWEQRFGQAARSEESQNLDLSAGSR